MVRGWKSSCCGAKYYSCTRRARCFGASSSPSMNARYIVSLAVALVSCWACHVDLPPHRLEVPLHAVDADRDGIDQREALGVFRQKRLEVTMDGHIDAGGCSFASTGGGEPETMFPTRPGWRQRKRRFQGAMPAQWRKTLHGIAGRNPSSRNDGYSLPTLTIPRPRAAASDRHNQGQIATGSSITTVASSPRGIVSRASCLRR
jgi:hypothetical protein